MNLNDISAAKEELKDIFGSDFSINSIENIKDITFVNDYTAIKVFSVSKQYPENIEIEILDETGNPIAILCNVTPLKEIPNEYLTEYKFYAFLFDGSLSELRSGRFLLKNKYIIIHKDYYNIYMSKYHDTSLLWGKYLHQNSFADREPLKENNVVITAVENLHFPTTIHKEISVRSLDEPYAFERYLKTYHLIELVSDYYLVNEIKKLGEDLYGIGNLLSEYESNELAKLRNIFNKKLINLEQITKSMELIKNYNNIAYKIFQKYSKAGNPLNKKDDFNKFIELTDFSESSVSAKFRNWKGDIYRKMVIDITSYWIYRIRCSIAHTKIGEFIFELSDEDFILYFAQKLIDSILFELLKKPT